MAESHAGQPVIAAPHDLASGIGIVLAGAVSPEIGHQGDGCAEIVRGSEPVLPPGVTVEEEEPMAGAEPFPECLTDCRWPPQLMGGCWYWTCTCPPTCCPNCQSAGN